MITNSTLNGCSHWAAPSLHNAAPNIIADNTNIVNSCDCSFAKDFYKNFGKSCLNCVFGKKQVFFNNY